MKIYTSVEQLIGGTPLLELCRTEQALELGARLLVKLEKCSPGGSVKDRIALQMIHDAEEQGLLKAGATIIEAPPAPRASVLPALAPPGATAPSSSCRIP